MYWLLGSKSKLSTRNKLPLQKKKKNTQTNLDLRNTTLGYGFHFQHKNPRMFLIESLAHDSGRTLESAEYGYPKGFPNTKS
jgi:hypothetical protein